MLRLPTNLTATVEVEGAGGCTNGPPTARGSPSVLTRAVRMDREADHQPSPPTHNPPASLSQQPSPSGQLGPIPSTSSTQLLTTTTLGTMASSPGELISVNIPWFASFYHMTLTGKFATGYEPSKLLDSGHGQMSNCHAQQMSWKPMLGGRQAGSPCWVADELESTLTR